MAEIKSAFNQGKMNKDLDERIIPNGQYRDALNIQVSTSEGSDVGTVQNILGNALLNTDVNGTTVVGGGWDCVGAVADEKNDKLYWFATNPSRDAILEYDSQTNNVTPVLVDTRKDVLKFTGDIITGINIISGNDSDNEDKLLLWTDNVNEPRKINIQRCIDGTEAFNLPTRLVVNNAAVQSEVTTFWTQAFSNTTGGTVDLYLSGLGTSLNPKVKEGDQVIAIETAGGSVFNPTIAAGSSVDRFVTAVNYTTGQVTIDNLIYSGLGIAAIGSFIKFNSFELLKEEHITVIKKNPTTPPTISLEANIRGSSNMVTDVNGVEPDQSNYIFTVDNPHGALAGITNYTNGGTQFVIAQNTTGSPGGNTTPLVTVQKKEGDIVDLYIKQYADPVYLGMGVDGEVPAGNQPDVISQCNWRVGDVLLVQKFEPSANQGPLQFNYQSRLKVLEKSQPYEIGNSGEYEQYFETELIEVKDLMTPNPDPPLGANPNTFVVELEEKEAGIFQTKIPRFAYRYKYEDNEYSAFSPFSEPAFLPSGFAYHPTKNPYNLGMVNYARSVIVQDFIPANIPDDVVQVDLLYKEERGTTVYSIDSFKPDDPTDSSSPTNPWNSVGSTPINFYNNQIVTSKGSYEITSDNLRGAIAENQLLRPYDNVPRKALAQEITGNRIVYGNYLQNYDLTTKPIVKAGYRVRTLTSSDYIDRSVAQKSLKSLRDYQVGVVYGDKYGRETPVFTEDDAAFDVPFKESSDVNQIYASLYGPQPNWAEYYKIYVKQSSGEYYNLVMDRVYRAEDEDNLWISFPSSDRNKITEDSYISLKKQIDLNASVTKENRFKVIDIKNQAPEFIKSKFVLIDELTSSDLSVSGFTQTAASSNSSEIDFDSSTWSSNHTDLFNALDEKLYEDPLSFVFFLTTGGITRASKRYHVSAYDSDYSFSFKEPVDANSDNWIADTSSSYNTDVSVKLYREEKLNKQEFEGRFFVKIVQNEITDKFIEGQIERQVLERVSGSASVYYLADENGTYNANGNPDYQNTNPSFDSTNNAHYASNGLSEWRRNFKFGTGIIGGTGGSGQWFFDQCYFYSTQSNNSLDPRSSKDEGPNYFRGIHTINSNSYVNGGPNAFQDQPNFYKMGRTYMNLSFGPVGDDLHETGGNQQGKHYGELEYGSLRKVNNQFVESFDEKKHNNQWKTKSNIEKKLVSGTKFKFKDKNGVVQPVTYEIKNVLMRRSYGTVPWSYVQAKINDYQNGSDWGGVGYSSSEGQAALYRMGEFGRKENRRVTFICEIEALDGALNDPSHANSVYNPTVHDNSSSGEAKNDRAVSLEFTTTFIDEGAENEISVSPAVWETEADDVADLNLYYEASQAYPLSLDPVDSTKSALWAPIGSRVWCSNPQYNRTSPEKNYNSNHQAGYFDPSKWRDPQIMQWNGNEVEIYPGLDVDTEENADEAGQANAYIGKVLRFFRPDMSFTSATITGVTEVQLNTTGMMSADKVRKVTVDIKKTVGLPWSNCFSFQNGVESNRIRDDFNKQTVTNGVRVSTTIEEPYAEERRASGLIYSSLYNSTNGVNGLNQFIQAEKITKDLSPRFGSIQKLFQRKTSLIAFCEDRVVGIVAGKDTLFNADGNPQLIASTSVLGDANPFVGDYGISRDPSSFAKESYRAYFTDRQRGAVLRLSMDGLTPISDAGMTDYFNDNLKPAFKLIGSYDDRKNEYNLTIDNGVQSYPDSETVSFKENVKGWVSFKSFIPDYGLSTANNYYTFYEGKLFIHHDETKPRNRFYASQSTSYVEAVLNDGVSIVKNFKTLNYEGDAGWTATIQTDMQSGSVDSFIEKENKHFNYIKGESGVIDTAAFNFQGIGTVNEIQ